MKILLLDEGQHQSLYLSRKLQEWRDAHSDIHIDVAIASSNTRRQKMANFFPAKFYPTPQPTDLGYRDRIAQLANDFDVIIPISNNCLPIAYDPSTSWSSKVFPALSKERFALLFDKFASTELAQSLEIQCPKTLAVECIEELDNAITQLGLPIVLKQCSGWAGSGVRICYSRSELEKQFQFFTAQKVDKLFCQQFISGTPCLAGGLFLDGEAIRIYCADHGFSYPPITGSSKSVISCDSADMRQALLKFCQATQWTGLANLDFMRSDDGQLYFLEINPRIWGSIAACDDVGIDIITPLVEILSGDHPTASLQYPHSVKSVLFPQYLLSLCQQGGYRNLCRVIGDRSLWHSAPRHNYRYFLYYLIKITHAWLHGMKRTLRSSLGLHNDTESAN